MIASFYSYLALPDACRLDKRIYKKQFLENTELTAADRAAFSDDVDTLTWRYTLKPSTLPAHPYTDERREYLEIAVLELVLREPRRMTRLAELVHRAIPYPLLLVGVHQGQVAVSLAHKRYSQAEKGAVVAEAFEISDWIDTSAPTEPEQQFLQSLAVTSLPQTHYYALYSAWHDRLLALRCAALSGEFRLLSHAEQGAERRDRLAACHQMQGRLTELKSAIKKETQFNRKVELNMQIKQLEKQLAQATAEL